MGRVQEISLWRSGVREHKNGPYFNLSGITQEADATAETAAPAPAAEAAESNNTPAPIDDDQDFTIELVQRVCSRVG